MALPTGLYYKSVTCPVCQMEFQAVKLKSQAVKLLRRDADFCGYYAGHNPVFYGITLCENCGYAAFETDFEAIRPAEREIVKQAIVPKWTRRTFSQERSLEDAIQLHQLALICYSVLHRKPSDIGKICLRLAWFYRALGKGEKELHFVAFAEKQYMLAFEKEALEETPEEQMLIYYLIGELKRQLGDYQKALYWFQESLKLPHIKTRKPIETLVRDQIALTRTAHQSQKNGVATT